MAQVMFKQGTWAAYSALATKDPGTIYFITDKNRLFKGDVEYSRPIAAGAGAPSGTATADSLYIDSTNFALYHFGTAWNKIGHLMSEVKFEGEGNVITAARFENGVLTFVRSITAATSEELGAVEKKIDDHLVDKNNPHGVTPAQIGAYTKDETAALINEMQSQAGAHSHTNKAELDKIADGDVAKWNAEIGAKEAAADALAEAQKKVAGVKEGEKVLSVANNLMGTTLTLHYDEVNKKIQLLGINDAVVAELDATAFIKDGMLAGATYDPDADKLILSFNTDAGKENIEVPLSDLVYTAGNGINITDNKISVVIDPASEDFLTVGAAGVKLSGVQSAIDAAKQAAIDDAAGKDTALKNELTGAIGTAKQEAIDAAAGDATSKANAAQAAAIEAAGTAADQKIAALNLGTMSQKDAANYSTTAEVEQKIADAAMVWGDI